MRERERERERESTSARVCVLSQSIYESFGLARNQRSLLCLSSSFCFPSGPPSSLLFNSCKATSTWQQRSLSLLCRLRSSLRGGTTVRMTGTCGGVSSWPLRLSPPFSGPPFFVTPSPPFFVWVRATLLVADRELEGGRAQGERRRREPFLE